MENRVTYAGFWKRFLAYFVDQLILGFVKGVIFVPLWFIIFVGYFMQQNPYNEEEFTLMRLQNFPHDGYYTEILPVLITALIFFGLLSLIGDWLYFALMESSNKQGTLGKMIVGIKVTDLSGNKISFGRATGRYFAKIISGIILFIGYIMAGFTEKKQALHDILASCLVVNKFNF